MSRFTTNRNTRHDHSKPAQIQTCRHHSRRQFIKSSLAAAAALSTVCQPPVQKPNILFIFSDQQHWAALQHVDSFFRTPHLSELARHSVRFRQAVCTTPQCSPSRSSMLTGYYPHKTGVMGNIGAAGGDELDQPTFALPLSQAGYRTACFGKWHLGYRPVSKQGWDIWDDRDPHHAAGPDAETTRLALEFLKFTGDDKRPFCLTLSYVDPHDIYQFRSHTRPETIVPLPESWHRETFADKPPVHKQFMTEDQGTAIYGKPKELWQQYRDWYRIKVEKLDEQVGQVIQYLRDNGLWESTVVLFTSDHGDMDAHHRLIYKGPFMYEQMLRVPLMIRVPSSLDGLSPTDSDVLTIGADIAPTILDFAGCDVPDCDGRSLKPLLTGGIFRERAFAVSQYYSKQKWINPIRSIRSADWKYNLYQSHAEELYDLRNDPHERVNRVDDPGYAHMRNSLHDELKQWINRNEDPFVSLPVTDRLGNIKNSRQ